MRRQVADQPRHARHQLRQLEAGEGAGDAHVPREFAELDAALAGQTLEQARVGRVRPVEHQDVFPRPEQPRQKIVAQPRCLPRTVIERQAPFRQPPRLRQACWRKPACPSADRQAGRGLARFLAREVGFASGGRFERRHR